LSEEYYTWISPLSGGSASSGSSYLFSGNFMADEVVGVGGMGQETSLTVNVKKLMEAFLNM
jgi:hypothetical protein